MRSLVWLFLAVLASAASFGVMPTAVAASGGGVRVALCVGCTANTSFEGAAWQAVGTNWVGEREVLVVNPDSGLSRWVFLTHYPTGVSPRASQSRPTLSPTANVPIGQAVGVQSDPFAAIYVAGDTSVHINASGTSTASARPVSSDEQMAINTARAVTEKTYFVRLDPAMFPSYESSKDWQIANVNWVALENAGIGWPVSAVSNKWFKGLLDLLGVYTGHAFVVCDIFGNGDVACLVPDPIDKNVANQSGNSTDVDEHVLPDIMNRVAGGGSGAEVSRSTKHVTYWPPGWGGGGGGSVVCGYVNGRISTCIKQD